MKQEKDRERGKREVNETKKKYFDRKVPENNIHARWGKKIQANTKLGKENKGEHDEAKRGVNILLALSGAAQTNPFCSILGHDTDSP